MASTQDILNQEAALGRWPRRLLHVGSLVSHEWQRGNWYGGAREPRYAAITYTWGRWKLQDHERLDILAIPIQGVPWSIPRVSPTHFTVRDLSAAIHQASLRPSLAVYPEGQECPESVDFVWLDVACIDQRENLESASEVGRQADIFRNASFVYAWLNQTSKSFLTEACTAKHLFDSPDPNGALSIVSRLLADPWFSSLWTLQEAFLRSDAVFLSKDAQTASGMLPWPTILGGSSAQCFTLGAATYFINGFKMKTNGVILDWSESDHRAYRATLELGEKAGLYALSLKNPVVTYILAKYRQTERKEDRVYGIQQIFGFRLGKTTPGWNGQPISWQQLEDELATAVLRQYPVQSQMHVFVERPSTVGSAWRVNGSSIFPKMNRPFFPWLRPDQIVGEDARDLTIPTCEMWVENEHGVLWGWYNGWVCDFGWLVRLRNEMEAEVQHQYDLLPQLTVFLDRSQDLDSCPYYDIPAENHSAQRDLIDWLVKKSRPNCLKVLELGTRGKTTSRFGVGDLHYGILVVPKQITALEYYGRIGFCVWYGTSNRASHGESSGDWHKLTCRFG